MTKAVLGCLRAQRSVALNIVVIDDGSSDGTADFLETQEDVTTLRGDGSLWWGGAIDLGLRHVLPKAGSADYVLFLNNDTEFEPDFISNLVTASKRNNHAAVGSIIRNAQPPHEVLSIGPKVDYWRFAVWDLLATDAGKAALAKNADIDVPMLSGRGSLYPVEAFARAGFMRPRILPHYFADYELADRVRRSGIRIVVSCSAVVHSLPEWGNNTRRFSWWQRWFSKRSASNLFFTLAFWSLVGSPIQRCTAVPRWIFFKAIRSFKQYRNSQVWERG
jgi:GT2 family glycosyltransferase